MTVDIDLLGPVVALALWTMLMLFVAVYKVQKGLKSGVDLGETPRGARGRDLDGRMDAKWLWARQNYEHLVEQPTIFYAVVIALALLGQGQVLNLGLAWTYVVLRVAHSIVQATGRSRSVTFVLSTLVLLALVIHACAAWLHLAIG